MSGEQEWFYSSLGKVFRYGQRKWCDACYDRSMCLTVGAAVRVHLDWCYSLYGDRQQKVWLVSSSCLCLFVGETSWEEKKKDWCMLWKSSEVFSLKKQKKRKENISRFLLYSKFLIADSDPLTTSKTSKKTQKCSHLAKINSYWARAVSCGRMTSKKMWNNFWECFQRLTIRHGSDVMCNVKTKVIPITLIKQQSEPQRFSILTIKT